MNNPFITLAGNISLPTGEFLILNADDTEAARYAKSKILVRAGFRVIEASNGHDALALALAEQPDLILLDTKMPDINGFEVCRRLKANPETQAISILQTSASFVRTTDKIAALDGGADNYLFEPIEPEELIANIKALIRLSHAEKEIREINRRKDVFLATLAHELRNPLGPIKNSIKLLQKLNPFNDDKNANLLDVISRQTDQMTRLVDDLLDVSRISQGKISLQTANVLASDFITAAVESSAKFIEDRGHVIDIEIAAEPLWIVGDKVRLVQIISNLLNNAAKFTPRGGVIRLRAYKQNNDFLIIDIADNGIGLTESQQSSIFELFVQHGKTEDRAHEGLGIGLSLVKNLTFLHDADIKVFSLGLNKGSTFTVTFKITHPLPVTLSEVNEIPNDPHLSKILVIDDNIDAANTLAELLLLIGHDVKTAHTGKKGIETAIAFEPDVVFLDIGLPDMYGYEVAKHIRSNNGSKKLHLFALTGYGTEADQKRALDSGFDMHLTKPLDFERLKAINLGF